jgi:Toxin SymE, type I toxin-antitoxin system
VTVWNKKRFPLFGFRFRLRAGFPLNAPVSPFLWAMNTRTLKIEAAGDFFYDQVSPKIRLAGQWLERAGFKPGHRVEVQISQPGLLTLRFQEQVSTLHDETDS